MDLADNEIIGTDVGGVQKLFADQTARDALEQIEAELEVITPKVENAIQGIEGDSTIDVEIAAGNIAQLHANGKNLKWVALFESGSMATPGTMVAPKGTKLVIFSVGSIGGSGIAVTEYTYSISNLHSRFPSPSKFLVYGSMGLYNTFMVPCDITADEGASFSFSTTVYGYIYALVEEEP